MATTTESLALARCNRCNQRIRFPRRPPTTLAELQSRIAGFPANGRKTGVGAPGVFWRRNDVCPLHARSSIHTAPSVATWHSICYPLLLEVRTAIQPYQDAAVPGPEIRNRHAAGVLRLQRARRSMSLVSSRPSITIPLTQLKTMQTFLKRFYCLLRDEDGPTAVEYAVMLSLIVAVCLSAISTVGSKAASVFSRVANSI